jgi:hypothetical protein
MELTQFVFLVSLICFSIATISIFLIGSSKDMTHGVSFGEQKSKKKHMDDIL